MIEVGSIVLYKNNIGLVTDITGSVELACDDGVIRSALMSDLINVASAKDVVKQFTTSLGSMPQLEK